MKIRQFMDCFLPIPVVGKLEENCWGAKSVIPRDQDNGLEDKVLEDPAVSGKVNYTYWDGSIVYDEDECGKYHLFASRWNEADGFEKVNGEGGWSGSLAVEAVSDCLYGPYDQKERLLWPDSQGGLYHCVVNQWSARKAFYIISENGLDGWKLADGIAYSPTVDFLRYENSDVVNRWNKIERPGVYIEDGIVRAMTFSVLDLPKEEDKGNDGHASKVIVVPFDGEALNQFAKEQYYGK